MKNSYLDEGIRERLIIAGIREIELHGLNDFSLRRVASACRVSCAAPYRHYKNKDELVLAIIAYIISRWEMMGDQIESAFEGNTEKQLVEICIAYVRFLIANTNYLSILLPVQSGMTELQREERKKLWRRMSELLQRLAEEKGIDGEKRAELDFLLETLIYGTVTILDGDEASDCDKKIEFMRSELRRIVSNT